MVLGGILKIKVEVEINEDECCFCEWYEGDIKRRRHICDLFNVPLKRNKRFGIMQCQECYKAMVHSMKNINKEGRLHE